MKCNYQEITDVMGEPLWWDESGVPRYIQFSYNLTANIYAQEAALIEIECQNCGHLFKVCASVDRYQQQVHETNLREHILKYGFNYGDPPVGCCTTGATMSSVAVRVLEFWSQEQDLENEILIWKKDSSLKEIDLRPDWSFKTEFLLKDDFSLTETTNLKEQEIIKTAAQLKIDLNN